MSSGLEHEFQLRRAELEIQGATDIEAMRDLALRMLRLLEVQRETFIQVMGADWPGRPPR